MEDRMMKMRGCSDDAASLDPETAGNVRLGIIDRIRPADGSARIDFVGA